MEAYHAMILFLEQHLKRTNSDDLAALLSSMIFLEDGSTADPAVWIEWLECIRTVDND